MALFEWSDDYSVKVASIDAQHKVLVGMLNELHDGMSRGSGNDHLSAVLSGLIQYTAQHFAHEEALFAEHGFEDAEEHIAEHQRLVKQVLEFQKKFDAKQASLNMELMRFLKDWLIKHILGSDMKYAALFVEKRVA
ncbi:MAG: bacteriohemerythrin [Myxococcota bacterium]